MSARITTFYSYKGGSGRSMAVANVAWALATNGERVLTIDWDLEAPGLHRYFHPFLQDPGQSQSAGLIDYLWEYIRQLTATATDRAPHDIPIDGLVQELQLPYSGPGVLHFIGAGAQDEQYSAKVGGLDWGTFYSRFGGEAFVNRFMDWARSRYTHVLIDSRTGVADSAGVCTMQLPDAVVMCAVYNRQSIEGTASVARSIMRARRERGMRELDVRVVPCRVEDRSNVTSARLHCYKSMRPVFPGNVHLANELRASEIKHFPWCSFEEKLAVFEEVPGDTGSLLEAMHRLASRIADRELKPIEIDSAVLTGYWRRAAFEDPRMAELEALSSATDSETVGKLLQWLDEAMSEPRARSDWMGALGLACVKQANTLGESEGRAAEFLSSHGFDLACQAYAQDRRDYRQRFSIALQARADFLQRIGELDEALRLARHALKLIDSRSVTAPWRRARAYERVAELTLATRGPAEALPLYKKMASLFDDMDLQHRPLAAVNDAFRAQRLLAEQYAQLEDHAAAFMVVTKALDDIRKTRHLHKRAVPDTVNLLGLYAEIGTLLYPERTPEILRDANARAEQLLDSKSASALLERRLAVIESAAHVRRNRMDDALAAIAPLDQMDARAHAAEPQLDETWEAQVALQLSLGRYAEARSLIDDLIRYRTRALSSHLCELILRFTRHTGDPHPLFDLVLKRVSSGNLEPHEKTMLREVLVQAAKALPDKQPVLQLLQEALDRAGAPSSLPGLDG